MQDSERTHVERRSFLRGAAAVALSAIGLRLEPEPESAEPEMTEFIGWIPITAELAQDIGVGIRSRAAL